MSDSIARGPDSILSQLLTIISPSADISRAVVSYWQKYIPLVLVNCLGGLGLPRNNVVRLTARPDMTIAVNCGRKATKQQQ